jgi:molybdopterin-guanine dinucleotide biosynthesis protein A
MARGAVVLCGGESRRMGQPKALLPFGPERLLQRVVRLVRQAADPVVVVSAPGQVLPGLPPETVIIGDSIAGRGPLQGLAAGLAAHNDSTTFIFATGTDVPFLAPRWVAFLEQVIGDHDVAIPFCEERHHPLAALYRRAATLEASRRLLDRGELRLTALLGELRVRVVAEGELRAVDPGLRTLININSPADYERAIAEAGFAR